jgi:hypothetical protein
VKRGRCGTHESYRRDFLRADTASLWCSLCRDYVSLGPANDVGCEVEIRAAELSRVPRGAFVTSDAQSGWYCGEKDFDPPPWPHCPDAWSGWLAHHITSHQDPG